jgi:hypothetical protein
MLPSLAQMASLKGLGTETLFGGYKPTEDKKHFHHQI